MTTILLLSDIPSQNQLGLYLSLIKQKNKMFVRLFAPFCLHKVTVSLSVHLSNEMEAFTSTLGLLID